MISAETVTRVLESMSTMSDAQAQAIVTQMGKRQPEVLAYLLATSENEAFDQDERQVFFYIGMVIWQIMKQHPNGRDRITETQLERAEKANEDLLEKMASDSSGDFSSATQSMIENYPEPEVLRYLTQALMEDEEGNPDNPPIRDENLGLAFLSLKIVLDAFIGKTT
ncbi:MAG: hypothetical protein AAB393_01750 [Bacteroidota bacterium]